jgi:hypothetical protein
MVEINIRDNNIQLEEFKVERTNQWNHETGKSEVIPKTCIIINNIPKSISDKMKAQVKGNAKTEAFGRFKFEGSVSFNINDFYITLHNVELSGWTHETSRSRLKINFRPLEGFGYLSGMGLNVLREEKLKAIGL